MSDATRNATPTGHLYLQIVGACSIPGRAGFPRFISKGGTTQCSYLPNRSSALCNVSLKISCEKVDAICDFIAKFFFPDQTLLFFLLANGEAELATEDGRSCQFGSLHEGH